MSIEKFVEYEFVDPGTAGLRRARCFIRPSPAGALSLDKVLACLTTGPSAVLGRNDLGIYVRTGRQPYYRRTVRTVAAEGRRMLTSVRINF